jgi:AAA+ ATPase superfamily predicted ATPase
LYLIKDNFFRFWHRFVPDNMSQIMAGRPRLVYESEIDPHMDQYMGIPFEDICKQYLIRCADPPFAIKEIGSWWGGNPETRTREEIDILAVNRKNAIFGECKWTKEKVDTAVLTDLKRKAKLFREFETRYYYLFSRSGFTSGVVKVAEEDDLVRLISLADIYGC